jgi:hypothetical protein
MIRSGTLSESYRSETISDLNTTAELVASLYRKMANPEEFSLLTKLYFAAMSYTEMAWRLNKPHLASAFLLRNSESFHSGFVKILAKAQADKHITQLEIESVIKPFDIAGLTDWSRQNWHPVHFDDLRASTHKLNATPSEIEALLRKLGVFGGP